MAIIVLTLLALANTFPAKAARTNTAAVEFTISGVCSGAGFGYQTVKFTDCFTYKLTHMKLYVDETIIDGKHILDCCCGSRMFWFDKQNPAVLFADVRELSTELCDGRKLEIKPDIIADFRDMPFKDNTFNMVVFDPPHLNKLGNETWMAQKYGVLLPSWEHDIKQGFDEAMRVLQPFGTLIFKWNEIQITTQRILRVIGVKPLFGHPSGKHGRTKWMAFMKGVSK